MMVLSVFARTPIYGVRMNVAVIEFRTKNVELIFNGREDKEIRVPNKGKTSES